MFSPLEIAQQILDEDLSLSFQDGCLIVADGKYSKDQSIQIVAELKDMHRLSMRCQIICDPVRNKLESLVLACESC
ncbi:MAG: hypothetical protein PHU71_01545 [Candidatus Gracilibacteria bacterium]|nr:hypothetical protein [Candidatus Gracilibacteria bacterium]